MVDSLIDLINQSLLDQKNDVIKFVEKKFERRLSEELLKVGNRIANLESKVSKSESSLLAKNS